MATGEGVRVEASGLSRRFGDVTALSGVDLNVDDPEVLGIAGPNGSGKTTLIRCLLGLLAPSAGTVSVFGTASTALGAPDRRRPVRGGVRRHVPAVRLLHDSGLVGVHLHQVLRSETGRLHAQSRSPPGRPSAQALHHRSFPDRLEA